MNDSNRPLLQSYFVSWVGWPIDDASCKSMSLGSIALALSFRADRDFRSRLDQLHGRAGQVQKDIGGRQQEQISTNGKRKRASGAVSGSKKRKGDTTPATDAEATNGHATNSEPQGSMQGESHDETEDEEDEDDPKSEKSRALLKSYLAVENDWEVSLGMAASRIEAYHLRQQMISEIITIERQSDNELRLFIIWSVSAQA